MFTLGVEILQGLVELCSLPHSNGPVPCHQDDALDNDDSRYTRTPHAHSLVFYETESPVMRLRRAVPSIFQLAGKSMGVDLHALRYFCSSRIIGCVCCTITSIFYFAHCGQVLTRR